MSMLNFMKNFPSEIIIKLSHLTMKVIIIIIIVKIIIIIIFMVLQPFVGPWPPFQFLDSIHIR
jgi:hypothetical protein